MRTLLILTVVAVALGGYIFFVERHQSGTDQVRADRVKLFPTLIRAAITEIQIQTPGAPTAVFTRDGAGWKLSSKGVPANDAAVDELLTEIDLGEVDRAADVSAQAAGLDKPAFTIALGAGPRRFVLRGGRPDPTGRGVYVQRGEDPAVVVAPRRVLELAARDSAAFRDRRVIPAPVVAEAAAIEWVDGAVAGSVGLKGGRWQNQRQEWVARERVIEALRNLAELKADRFVPARDGAPSAEHNLNLQLTSGQTFALRARPSGCPEPEQVALQRSTAGAAVGVPGENEWLCLPKQPWQALWGQLPAVAERDLRLVAAPANDIIEVAISEPPRRLILRREVPSAPWTIAVPPVTYQADGDFVDQWLAELRALALTPAPQNAATAVKGASRRVTVQSRFAETAEVDLRRGPRPLIRRQGERETAPLSAPGPVLPLTEPDPLRFRSRAVLSFPRYDAQRVRMTGGGHPEEAVKDARESWRLAQPAPGTLDQDALDRKLGAVTNLRAVEFIAPDGGPAFRATHTLEVKESGGRTHRLEIAAASANSPCRARINDGAKTVFVLAPDICLDLTRPLTARP